MLTQATTSDSTNKHSLSQDGSSDRNRQEMGHLSSILCSHKQQHLTAQTNTAYHKMGHLIGAAKRWDISAAYTVLTQATHLTAQTNTAYHKMGHLIGAAKRWDISAAYCAHTSNTSNSTNKHSLSQDGSSAKRWDISAAYCAHTSNTSNSTNKHSLSQDGSSDRSRQEMGHLSSILCSRKQQHLTAQTNTAYHKMGHLIGTAKRWDISAAYCAHTSNNI